jgi:predicted alpha/beta superfamily hydrolase
MAGGADSFLRFIREELLPEVDRKYRTAPFRILMGHSLGGLFALHAFSRSPGLETFRRHLAAVTARIQEK